MYPGWLGVAGCLRAAWPPGKPAWPPAELRTTAAKSARQVERERQGERKETRGEEKRRREGKHEYLNTRELTNKKEDVG